MESTTLPNAGCSRKRPSSSLCIGSVTSFMFGTACVVLEGDPVASKVEYCSCLAEGEDWAPFAAIRGHGEREAEEEPDASCAFLTSAKAAWHCSSDTFPTVANSQRTSLRSHDPLEDSDSFKDGEAYSTRPAVCHLKVCVLQTNTSTAEVTPTETLAPSASSSPCGCRAFLV